MKNTHVTLATLAAIVCTPLVLHSQRGASQATNPAQTTAQTAAQTATPSAGALAASEKTFQASFAEIEAIGEVVRLYEEALRVVADNLVNADTTGFKRRRVRFVQSDQGLALDVQRDFAQGHIASTGNPLDIAIDGAGFLAVQSPTGETVFTRDGALHLNDSGGLVTIEGWPLMNSPSGLDRATLRIQRNGTIWQTPASGVPTQVGSLAIHLVDKPDEMNAIVGQHLFLPRPGSGQSTATYPGKGGAGVLIQGSLESSTVSFDEERLRAHHLNRRLHDLLEIVE